LDIFEVLGFSSAAVGVGLVLVRILSSIARITGFDESKVRIKPLFGNERFVPLSEIVDLSLVSILGVQTHATVRTQPKQFWSLAHSSFLIPVRWIFMDQQGLIQAIWGHVPSKESRL
jgi:hypothetical protein